MARVTINRTSSDQKSLDAEIASLRDLSVKDLKARWRTILRREAPAHVPRHLLLRTLAYRLQVNAFGDLDEGEKRLLERAVSLDGDQSRKADLDPVVTTVQQGTILSREWKGRMHRVAVLANGFAWNGKTYPSLSKVALEITGTRWNGPRFFGLRDKAAAGLGARS